MAKWRPVETAPKDGRAILSWDGDTYAVVIWCGCKREWQLVEHGDNRPHPEDATPWIGISHWMPLPTPPTQVAE